MLLIGAIRSLYEDTRIRLDTSWKKTHAIPTNRGIRQQCYTSPVLLTIYTDYSVKTLKSIFKQCIRLHDTTPKHAGAR